MALLVIDIGNTHMVLGCYTGETLRSHWRVSSDRDRTGDEWFILLRQLFAMDSLREEEIRAAIVSSVVPPMTPVLEEVCRKRLGVPTRVVGPGLKTGIPILYDNPREVGADRVVNAVAAHARWQTALIIVDFGTATTFDAVSAGGAYLGGAIAPGLRTSLEALSRAASMLPRVELIEPKNVIGRNTIASMQSGIYFGYAGLVDGIVTRMKAEMDTPPKVVATGGLSALIAPSTVTIEEVEPFLTLEGLRILWERNS
ncbi:MAG: type III pantothenate kinase [Deltaproteobacteria bacterium]|nr:type III pantothenate kinase [Deltaproteobacteria bacterium]